jgi:hypothetical protein
MLKPCLVIVPLWLTPTPCFAQTQTTAPNNRPATAARPNTNAPTKVTGDPVKHPTGSRGLNHRLAASAES